MVFVRLIAIGVSVSMLGSELAAYEPETLTQAVQVYGLGEVRAAAFSPDGTRVLFGAAANAQLWAVAVGGGVIRTFTGHTGRVMSVAFSPDGGRIATASEDKTARIWNVDTGATIHVLNGHSDQVRTVEFSPNGHLLLTASLDNTARIWNVASGALVRQIAGHSNDVTAATFHPDGSKIATCSLDGSARLWNANTAGLMQVYPGSCGALAFSSDGSLLATRGPHAASIWDTDKGVLRHSVPVGQSSNAAIAFINNGSQFVTNQARDYPCYEQGALLVDLENGLIKQFVVGGCRATVAPLAIAVSKDESKLLTANADWTARLWDVASTGVERSFSGHTGPIYSVAISPDGTQVATASRDKTVRIWDRFTGRTLHELNNHTDAVGAVAYSPDGSKILTGSVDHSAILWNAYTGEKIRSYLGHTCTVSSVAFSPNGEEVITASCDGTARIRDTVSGALVQVFSGGNFPDAEFWPDATKILLGPGVWDIATGQAIGAFDNLACGGVASATASFDGSKVAVCGWHCHAGGCCVGWTLWDVVRHQGRVATGHSGIVRDVAFSPDGCRVATASDDATARVWDARTLLTLTVVRGHVREVNRVVLDETSILTASEDGTARLSRADVVPPCDGEQPLLGEDVPARQINIDRLWEWNDGLARFAPPGSDGVNVDPARPTYLLTHGWDGTLDGAGAGESCGDASYALSSLGCAIREVFPDVNLIAWNWEDGANPNRKCDVPDAIIEAGGETAVLAIAELLLTGGISMLDLVAKGATLAGQIMRDARLSGLAARDEGIMLGAKLAEEIRRHGSLGSELHLIGKSHGGGVLGMAAQVLRNRGLAADSLTTLDTPRVCVSGFSLGFLGTVPPICVVNSLSLVDPTAVAADGRTAVFHYPDLAGGGFGQPLPGAYMNLQLNPDLVPGFSIFDPLNPQWIDHLWISGLDEGVCLGDDGWFPQAVRASGITFDGGQPLDSILDVWNYPAGCFEEGNKPFRFSSVPCPTAVAAAESLTAAVSGLSTIAHDSFQTAATWSGTFAQLEIGADPADQLNRVVVMSEQGNASFFKDILWPHDTLEFSFDYVFLAPRGLESLTVYLGEEVVYYDDADVSLATALTSSGPIHSAHVAGTTARLNFVLRTDQASGGQLGGAVLIDNLRIYGFRPGDVDFDGDRDLVSFYAFQRCFQNDESADACGLLDFNGDRVVDLTDYAGDQKGPSMKGLFDLFDDPRIPPTP